KLTRSSSGDCAGNFSLLTSKLSFIGKKYLEIGQDFKSDRGSDLKVILHQAATVDFRVQEEEYSNLAALQASLQAFSDAQHYLISDNVDLSNYQSVAILV
ncbi:MAG: DM13 domain-containing protein, partial [Cyanobacteria bacterium J06607_15]